MRANEFIKENASAGATSAGSVAPVAMPLGNIIKRNGSVEFGKYTNTKKLRKKHARG